MDTWLEDVSSMLITMWTNYIALWTGTYGEIAQLMMIVWHVFGLPLFSLLIYTAVTGQIAINRSNKKRSKTGSKQSKSFN